MSKRSHDAIDPNLDLVLERTVDVPPQLVWRAWTEPALVTQWFTPAPWTTVDCEIDLRTGGLFRTVMRSPRGTGSREHRLLPRHRRKQPAGVDRHARCRLSAARRRLNERDQSADFITAFILLAARRQGYALRRARPARHRGRPQTPRGHGLPPGLGHRASISWWRWRSGCELFSGAVYTRCSRPWKMRSITRRSPSKRY